MQISISDFMAIVAALETRFHFLDITETGFNPFESYVTIHSDGSFSFTII